VVVEDGLKNGGSGKINLGLGKCKSNIEKPLINF